MLIKADDDDDDDDEDEENPTQDADVPTQVPTQDTDVPTQDADGIIDLPSVADPGRRVQTISRPITRSTLPARRNRNAGMADNVMQMMMMDMQQRMLENQEMIRQQNQERIEQRHEATQSRMLLAQAIDSIAKAFVHNVNRDEE